MLNVVVPQNLDSIMDISYSHSQVKNLQKPPKQEKVKYFGSKNMWILFWISCTLSLLG